MNKLAELQRNGVTKITVEALVPRLLKEGWERIGAEGKSQEPQTSVVEPKDKPKPRRKR